jgi:hypothetical protein
MIGKHENIMCLEDIMIRDVADELYLVMELFDSDLHRVIQSQQVSYHIQIYILYPHSSLYPFFLVLMY